MTKKMKLVLLISTICVCFSIFGFGAYAITINRVNYTISGSVDYDVGHLELKFTATVENSGIKNMSSYSTFEQLSGREYSTSNVNSAEISIPSFSSLQNGSPVNSFPYNDKTTVNFNRGTAYRIKFDIQSNHASAISLNIKLTDSITNAALTAATNTNNSWSNLNSTNNIQIAAKSTTSVYVFIYVENIKLTCTGSYGISFAATAAV